MPEPLTDDRLKDMRLTANKNVASNDAIRFTAGLLGSILLDEIDRLKAKGDPRHTYTTCDGCHVYVRHRHTRDVGDKTLCIHCIVKLVPDTKP